MLLEGGAFRLTEMTSSIHAVEKHRPVVLQVLPSLNTGGAERSAVDVAIAAKRAGWHSLVASAGGRLVRELEASGVEHIAVAADSKNPIRMWRNIGQLMSVIRTRNVDIVHVRSRAPAWSAWAAARRSRRIFVTTFHGRYRASNACKRFYNRVMARGDKVIAVSDFIAGHVRETYGVDYRRLITIHRGTDLESFDPAAVSVERIARLAKEWGVPVERPVVMLPGRLTRLKGHSVLIDAVSRLDYRDLVVLLVGGDQGRKAYRQELERGIRELGLEGVIRVTGHCSDMPAAYMLADVVVSASTQPESFGRVAVEAQAMGRPIIATDHGGSRETVIDGRTGWLIPPGDVEAMAQALRTTLRTGFADCEALVAETRARLAENFSVERMCRATLEIYADLLEAQ